MYSLTFLQSALSDSSHLHRVNIRAVGQATAAERPLGAPSIGLVLADADVTGADGSPCGQAQLNALVVARLRRENNVVLDTAQNHDAVRFSVFHNLPG